MTNARGARRWYGDVTRREIARITLIVNMRHSRAQRPAFGSLERRLGRKGPGHSDLGPRPYQRPQWAGTRSLTCRDASVVGLGHGLAGAHDTFLHQLAP